VSRAEEFEGLRARLFSIAYRILGSMSEAEDAVQETWLRYEASRDGPSLRGGARSRPPVGLTDRGRALCASGRRTASRAETPKNTDKKAITLTLCYIKRSGASPSPALSGKEHKPWLRLKPSFESA
jgi:Sigma-70 region 2